MPYSGASNPALTSTRGRDIVNAVVGEFNEMPGMKLTRAQICRLWQLPHDEAERVIAYLVKSGFLKQDSDHRYGRATDRPA